MQLRLSGGGGGRMLHMIACTDQTGVYALSTGKYFDKITNSIKKYNNLKNYNKIGRIDGRGVPRPQVVGALLAAVFQNLR